MTTAIITSDQLKLPKKFASKFKGKRIRFVEMGNGILLSPVSDPVKEARGLLKGSIFTSEKYMHDKQEEKSLEA